MADSIESFRTEIKRRAIEMEIGGFRPSDDPQASWFGKIGFGMPGETWPMTVDGRPMVPLAQINCAELPFRPPRMEDFAFLTVFVDADLARAKKSFCVRTYPSLDGLVPLQPPRGAVFTIKPFPMRPRVIEEDYPIYDDLPCERPEEVKGSCHTTFKNVDGFKLGGWPSLIQSEISWAPWNQHPDEPEFVFQIDSTAKGRWFWGHAGVGYFGRGTAPGHENEWALAWQCL